MFDYTTNNSQPYISLWGTPNNNFMSTFALPPNIGLSYLMITFGNTSAISNNLRLSIWQIDGTSWNAITSPVIELGNWSFVATGGNVMQVYTSPITPIIYSPSNNLLLSVRITSVNNQSYTSSLMFGLVDILVNQGP
jgi:hypothetical protein